MFDDFKSIKPFEDITKALGQLATTGYNYARGVFYSKTGQAIEEIGEGLQKEGAGYRSEADKRAIEARRLMGGMPARSNILLIGGAVVLGLILLGRR